MVRSVRWSWIARQKIKSQRSGDERKKQEKEASYPRQGRSGGGAPEEPSPGRLLLAICSEEGEEARIFELEEEEGKGSLRKKKAKVLHCTIGGFGEEIVCHGQRSS